MEHIVILKPESPFHIGEAGVGLEETSVIVHSDTLFSALCNMYALLYGGDELEAMLEKFDEEPPFLVSSAFLYAGNILTFPLPLGVDWSEFVTEELLEELQKDRHELTKELRSARFVSQDVFLSILKGTPVRISIPPVHNILFSQNEDPPKKIFSVSEAPRVAMDRKTHTSAIYHVGEVYYASDCGLYFFLKTNPEYDKRIRACINLLGHEGLGGKRTSGRGLFHPAFKKSLRIPQPAMKITLSLTFPKPKELPVVKEGFYGLVSRRGWIYTPQLKSLRKKGVRMLVEGSTFPQKVEGQLADVTPESVPGVPRIKQYGLGYYLAEGEDND